MRQVCNLVFADHRQKVREIGGTVVISNDRVDHILHEILSIRKRNMSVTFFVAAGYLNFSFQKLLLRILLIFLLYLVFVTENILWTNFNCIKQTKKRTTNNKV